MGILAAVAVALIGLAIYAINKNNEISELKAPKIVIKDSKAMLQVTEKEREYIEANNQNKDKEGNAVVGEYRIDFTNSEGKKYYVIVTSEKSTKQGDVVFLSIKSQEMKGDDGKYVAINESDLLKALGLGTEETDGKVFNTYLEKVVVQQVTKGKGEGKD
ncbi:hypothetical protein [Wolbachia endosymbiont of Cantharis cryptica]|uniref:hypothetical protein n=1 Tax=Wolbachia endosymbiont of Cantharis cryptica TaxID=3066132 RepID=UPI00376ED575